MKAVLMRVRRASVTIDERETRSIGRGFLILLAVTHDDTEAQAVKLADKLCGAYATANFLQGGADVAIQSVLTQLLVKGTVIYSSGVSKGLPFIHLGPVCLKDQEEAAAELFQTYGTRFAAKALELFA